MYEGVAETSLAFASCTARRMASKTVVKSALPSLELIRKY